CVLQHNTPVRVRERGIRAKWAKICCDCGTCEVRDALVLLPEEAAENTAFIRPHHFTFPGESPGNIGSTRGVKRIPALDVQRRSRCQVQYGSKLPSLDQASHPSRTVSAQQFVWSEWQFERAVAPEIVSAIARESRVVGRTIPEITNTRGDNAQTPAPRVCGLIANASGWTQRHLCLQ